MRRKSIELIDHFDYKTTQPQKLPPNFVEELFNLEMDIESPEVDIQLVNKLLQLYATAMEHYESIKSDRYLIFKNKTQSLLLKQNVNKAISKAQEITEINNNQKTQLKISDQDKAKQNQASKKRESIRMNLIQYNQSVQVNAYNFLKVQKYNLEHSQKIIKEVIQDQDSLIKKRLQDRKNKKDFDTMSTIKPQNNENYNINQEQIPN